MGALALVLFALAAVGVVSGRRLFTSAESGSDEVHSSDSKSDEKFKHLSTVSLAKVALDTFIQKDVKGLDGKHLEVVQILHSSVDHVNGLQLEVGFVATNENHVGSRRPLSFNCTANEYLRSRTLEPREPLKKALKADVVVTCDPMIT